MKKVILHIGIHKTGSSSIQRTLKFGYDTLLANGFLYPSTLSENHSSFFISSFSENPEAYHANRRNKLSRDEIEKRSLQQMRAIEKEIKDSNAHTLIFSAEDASVLKASALLKFFEWMKSVEKGVEFEIIFYTRHPVSFVVSAVQENVKGNDLTISQAKSIHMNNARSKYLEIVKNYDQVFGKSSISAFSFEDETKGPSGLVGGFLEKIGIPSKLLNEKRVNEGMSDEAVRIVSFIREKRPNVNLSRDDINVIAALTGKKGFLLDKVESEDVMNMSASDRTFLKNRFGIDYLGEAPFKDPAELTSEDEEPYFDALADLLPNVRKPIRKAILKYVKEI